MKVLEKNPYTECDFGDKRLTKRAVSISERLFVKYGQPLSQIFGSASDLRDLQVINCPTVSQNFRAKPRRVVVSLDRATPTVGQFIFWIFLKRGYEFFSNPKTTFDKLTSPHFKQTAQKISGIPVVLAVGDTSFLDYRKILQKRDDYGPTGNGGNGLILHSCLALEPDFGQPLGLLWEKLWHREKKQKPPLNEEPEQKKQRLRDLQVINCPTVSQNFRAKPRRVVVSLYRATPTVGQFIFWIFLKEKRKAQRKKAFEEKESYRWVEAFEKISKLFNPLKRKEKELLTRIIHVFDREGDIAEVFALISNNKNTGVVVRASHNRCLEEENSHLWEYVISQEVKCIKDVELPQTKKRNARTAPLEIRFCPISIKPPYRLKNESNFRIYAVYAREINVPDDCEPVEWMLLTTESVLTQQDAITILRWYTYRWRVEEYHKILKSGCKAESYRLSGESISAMLGFLTVIAAQLLRMTYLHRTSPHLPATEVLTKTQMDVLIASSPPKLKKEITSFTIDWAIHAIARLGGYLEHRKNSAIGIQVLWRGWLELENLCQGWLLRSKLNY